MMCSCSNQVAILNVFAAILDNSFKTSTPFIVELCADELVVGGGVGWSYHRRRRRAAHFSSAAAAWLYGRRRQTG